MLSLNKVYRIIDANLNRAGEGLRVLEDITRFCMNDKDLTEELKTLRHLILKEINSLPGKEKLIISRSSLKDVGKNLKEEKRKGFLELIDANFRRVQEAERSLEEFGKLILPSWGEKFRQFRFKTYEIEKQIKTKLRKKRNYALYAITKSSLPEKELFSKVEQAIKGGITALQLREKELSSREFLKRALKIKNMLPPHITFIINDRIDIALASDADGVHLGQDDIPLKIAREIMGEEKTIGISTHNVEQAKIAEEEGADYIGIGPVFPTSTKPDASPSIGCKLVFEVKSRAKIPVVAIGGISLDNLEEVLKTGVDGIAVVSAIFEKEDVLKATKNLVERIKKFKKTKDANPSHKK